MTLAERGLVTTKLADVTPYSGGIGAQYGDLATSLAAAGTDVTSVVAGQQVSGTLARTRVIGSAKGPWLLAPPRRRGKVRSVV